VNAEMVTSWLPPSTYAARVKWCAARDDV
jgi:hypothetical protein